jgi:hypothetical protein
MPKLYDQHARHIARLGPIVSFLALYHATRSGLDGARPVPMTRADAAELAQISPRHLRRHWRALIDLFRPSPDGWTRRAEAWPVPQGKRGRAPWYHPIRPRVLDLLMSLRSEGRGAYPALRLALWLLPRLRASMSAGKRSIPIPSRSTCRALSMSPRTLIGALAALADRGLIARARGGRVARLQTFCALSAAGPDTTVTVPDPVAASGQAGRENGTGHNGNGLPSGKDKAPSAPHNTREAREAVLAHRSVSKLTEPERAAWSMVCDPELLAGSPASPLSVQLAKWAGSPAGLLRWLDQERSGLELAANPFGWLWQAATAQGSRPGRPSAGELRRRKARGLALPVVDREPEPEPEPEPERCPVAAAELAAELEAFEASRRARRAESATVEADRRASDRIRSELEAAARRRSLDVGRRQVADLLRRLKNGGRKGEQGQRQGRERSESGESGSQASPRSATGGDVVSPPDRRLVRRSVG